MINHRFCKAVIAAALLLSGGGLAAQDESP